MLMESGGKAGWSEVGPGARNALKRARVTAAAVRATEVAAAAAAAARAARAARAAAAAGVLVRVRVRVRVRVQFSGSARQWSRELAARHRSFTATPSSHLTPSCTRPSSRYRLGLGLGLPHAVMHTAFVALQVHT
jgi:hypothetical protein